MIKYDIGMVSLSETPFIGDDGDNAGLYFNREFTYEYYRYTKEYDSNEPTKYKKVYDKNMAYSRKNLAKIQSWTSPVKPMNRGITKNSQKLLALTLENILV